MDEHTWAGAENCALVVVESLIWALLPGFLWPIVLLCLVLSLYLVYLRVLPCVHLLAKMDSREEAYG